MPSRFTKAAHKRITAMLIERDGPLCQRCGTPPAKEGPVHTIDHVNNDPGDDAMENFQLLCRRCNTAKRNSWVAFMARSQLTPYLYKKNNPARSSNGASRTIDPGTIDDQTLPVLVQLSRNLKERFQVWLIERLKRESYITQFDAIFGGAKTTGGSSQAIRDYLNQEMSSEGRVEMFREESGRKCIRIRQDKKG